MDVYVIKSNMSDNYFYLLSDEANQAALIDPIDGKRAVEAVREHGADLKVVINTHFHHDHIGGNDTVFSHFPEAKLITGRGDAERVDSGQSQPIDRRVSGGDAIELGERSLEVIDTPGHTPGHISVAAGQNLFSGDTIFVGGAGNCSFGGDPGVLFGTFRDVLRDLPEDTVFYPGHDYSVRNLEFILSIEPDNQRAEELLEDARAKNEAGKLFLTTLGQERAYNPFMRFDDPALADRLESEQAEVFAEQSLRSDSREEAVFRTVRELRNRW